MTAPSPHGEVEKATVQIVVHSIPSGSFDRFQLGFCLAMGAVTGVAFVLTIAMFASRAFKAIFA